MTPPEPARFEVRATAADHFAWLRTRLAIERTLMAWVRTSVSLIGFGFVIVQFFERLDTMAGARPGRFDEAPRYLGLGLIACGILALVISTWQYRRAISAISEGSFAAIAGLPTVGRRTPIIAVSVLLTLVGLFAFAAVLLRLP